MFCSRFLFLIVFLLGVFIYQPLPLRAQASIVGFVKEQSSGNQALANAEVWALGSSGNELRFSNSKGYFELHFPAKTPGDVIREISVTLTGYEIVNRKQLESYALRKTPADDPLTIVLCKTGTYRQVAAEYYQTIYGPRQEELLSEQKRLQDALAAERDNRAALQAELSEINDKLTNLPQVAEAAADYFATIDLDQATALQKAAVAALEKGDIDAALAAMPEEVMDDNMRTAQQRKAQLEGQLNQANQLIAQTIENYIFKAQLYISNGSYTNAERLYEKAIAADSNRVDHLYDYAVFLENNNRYAKALHWLDKVIAHEKAEPWQLGNAYRFKGQVYEETGRLKEAYEAYFNYSTTFAKLRHSEPGSDFYKNGLAISYSKLGEIYQAQGQLDSALLFFQQYSTFNKELYASNPQSEAMKNGLAISYSKLGEIYQAQGQLDSALLFFQQYSTFNKELYASNPQSEAMKNGLAISYSKLGDIYKAQGQLDSALFFFQQRSKLGEELYASNPQSEAMKNGLAISYSKLGEIYQAQGQLDSALLFFQQYSTFNKELYASNPQSEAMKNGLAISYSKLGDIYKAQGQLDSALLFFNKDLKLSEELYASNPQSEAMKNGLAISYSKLGDIYQAQGQLDSALFFFQQRSKLGEELYASNPQSEAMKNGLAISYERLGEIYQAQGQLDSALFFFQQRSKLGKELYASNPQSEAMKNGLASSYERLGDIYQAQGQLDSALLFFQQETDLFEELYTANPQSADMLFGLGVAYYKLGDVYELKSENEAALSYLLQAEEVFQLLYSVTGLSSHQRNYNYMVSRVNTLELQSNDPQIRAIYQLEKTIAGTNALAAKYPLQKELTTLHQEHLAATPNNHRLQLRTAEAYGSLSWYALFAEDFAEAETAARRGLALGGSATEWITTNLATSLLLQGKYDEAVAIYQQYLPLAYNSTRTWREVFTEDLDALEAAGISHKDVARIRALLEDE